MAFTRRQFVKHSAVAAIALMVLVATATAQEQQQSYPSALLPPVREPYIFLWGFGGEMPRHPGAVANARDRNNHELAQQGILPLCWFYGPQAPWKTKEEFLSRYRAVAEGPAFGITVDEWMKRTVGGHPAYKFEGSIEGMALAKRLDPTLYCAVYWRGEDSIAPLIEQGLPDLLIIEGYTHVDRGRPMSHGINIKGIKRRIDKARKLGAIERTIVMLGHILHSENYHDGHVLTPEILRQEVQDLRAYAPEMPGIAFYMAHDPVLTRAADDACREFFVDPAPEVTIQRPAFQQAVKAGAIEVVAKATPKDGRTIRQYGWFLDNRCVAVTETPVFSADLSGLDAGTHFVTVHAMDDGCNRAAAQVSVRVLEGPSNAKR